jgi:hypothetical protein
MRSFALTRDGAVIADLVTPGPLDGAEIRKQMTGRDPRGAKRTKEFGLPAASNQGVPSAKLA